MLLQVMVGTQLLTAPKVMHSQYQLSRVRLPFFTSVSVSKIHGSNSNGIGLKEVLREYLFFRGRHLGEATLKDIYLPNNVSHLLHASANIHKSYNRVETTSQLALRN